MVVFSHSTSVRCVAEWQTSGVKEVIRLKSLSDQERMSRSAGLSADQSVHPRMVSVGEPSWRVRFRKMNWPRVASVLSLDFEGQGLDAPDALFDGRTVRFVITTQKEQRLKLLQLFSQPHK